MDTLMGAETEYAFVLLNANGSRRHPGQAAATLMHAAQRQLIWLQSADGQGIFLSNGGKFYIDVGDHPEYATPECTTPWDLVRYLRAGDQIMARLATELDGNKQEGGRALIFRGNVGYDPPQSWGSHESYLTYRPPGTFAASLTPFLASRILFTGSGGFDPFSPGIEFTLSPRVAFLSTQMSGQTMHSRPIMNLRDEPLAGSGHHRLHVICADAIGSESAMWLRAGTTSLVIAALEASGQLLDPVGLRDPLAAMRTFAFDPTLTARADTENGRGMTAIEIQRRYLDLVGKQQAAGRLPTWAPEVIDSWQRMLVLLESDIDATAGSLDWSIKRTVYAEFCRSRGIAWEHLPHWTQALRRIQQAYARIEQPLPTPLTPEELSANDACRDECQSVRRFLAENGLDWAQLPQFLQLRKELFEIDTRFLQLDGLFATLERSGVLCPRSLDSEAVEAAVETPPDRGRASARGCFVRRHAGSKAYSCDWQTLCDHAEQKVIPLADPLSNIPLDEIVHTDQPILRR